jgi:hypothetical protein
MIDFDDFDDLLGQLRTPATPAELAAEHDVVDLMAAAHHSSKGNTMFTSRRARVATLIAAGIIGFGGVAAAGPKVLDLASDDSPSIEEFEQDDLNEVVDDDQGEDVDDADDQEKVVEEEQVVEQKVVEEEQAIEEVEPLEEPAAVDVVDESAFPPELCVEGNHGKTVSAVARGETLGNDEDETTISEGEEGYPSVTDAAHSSCGKSETAEADDDDVDEIDDVDGQEVESDDADDDADEDHDEESEDHDEDHDKKSEASQHSRSDKQGNSGHSGRGKSDD